MLAAGLLLVAFWLSLQLFGDQRDEQKSYFLTASLPEGQITRELLEAMQKLPGVEHCWPVFGVSADIRIGGYHGTAQLCGVELSSYPLEVTASAGAKALGTKPLLVAGEQFFSRLSDGFGGKITDRQAKILSRKIDSLEAELTLDTGNLKGKRATAAGFLGTAVGDRIYMDASQLRTWAAQAGAPCTVLEVCLKIKGKSNTEKAKENLAKAGFSFAANDTRRDAPFPFLLQFHKVYRMLKK